MPPQEPPHRPRLQAARSIHRQFQRIADSKREVAMCPRIELVIQDEREAAAIAAAAVTVNWPGDAAAGVVGGVPVTIVKR